MLESRPHLPVLQFVGAAQVFALALACTRLPPAELELPSEPETRAEPVFVETDPNTPANTPQQARPTAKSSVPGVGPERRKRSRLLFEEGLKAYRDGDFATALVRFEEAYALEPRTALLYNVAHTHEKLGDTHSACATYLEILDTTQPSDRVREPSEKRAQALGC
jgi:hypothetical protein